MSDFEFFKYDPSLAANAVFVALFGITAVGHTFLLVRNRTWYFIPFVLGCLCTFSSAVERFTQPDTCSSLIIDAEQQSKR